MKIICFLVCLFLLITFGSSCGTLHNVGIITMKPAGNIVAMDEVDYSLGGEIDRGPLFIRVVPRPSAFGGIVVDWTIISNIGTLEKGIVPILAMLVIDLPLSLVGDVLTLPFTK